VAVCDRGGCSPGLFAAPWSLITVRNSIIWGHRGADFFQWGDPDDPTRHATYDVAWSDVEMGCPSSAQFKCTEVMSKPPLFRNRGSGDYRLEYDSPVIDAGDHIILFVQEKKHIQDVVSLFQVGATFL